MHGLYSQEANRPCGSPCISGASRHSAKSASARSGERQQPQKKAATERYTQETPSKRRCDTLLAILLTHQHEARPLAHENYVYESKA